MKNKRTQGRSFYWVIPLLFLLCFYFFPLGSIIEIIMARNDAVLSSWLNWKIIGKTISFTFYQALLSTFITLLIGIPLAYMFGHFKFPGRQVMRIFTTLPFILPTVVVAAAFNALIGPRGWINLLLMKLFQLTIPPINLLNSLPAILIAHIFYNTSIVIRTVSTAWEQLNNNIEDAANVLGASPAKVFTRITLPRLFPSILSAGILVFLFDFTSFGVILMMGGVYFTSIEVEIYIQTMQFLNLKMAGFLSLIQLCFSMVLTQLSLWLSKGIGVQLTPIIKGERLKRPENLGQRVFIVISLTFLIVLFVLPTMALLMRSITEFSTVNILDRNYQWRFTGEHYFGLFINERESLFYVPPIIGLRNSILFAISAMVIAVGLGIMIAVGSQRNRRSGRILELLLMLPMGTSAVTLGLGYFVAFSHTPQSIRWFPLLIPFAHALIALPFVFRIIKPALEAIPTNLHHAAITLGVPAKELWKKIDIPLLRKQLITASVFSFAISLGEFGASSFLSRPEYPTLPLAIFRYLNLPGAANYGKAMAMAAILLIICGCGFFLIENIQTNNK